MRRERLVRVHHHRVPDEREQRDVVPGVGVRPALAGVRARPREEPPCRGGLVRAVQELAVEAARVRAVAHLERAAERAGEAEPAGDHVGEERRRRRDQPDLVALREVLLREAERLRPDHGRGVPLVDLVGQPGHVGDRDAGHDLEAAGARRREVPVVLAARLEARVLPSGADDVARREEAGRAEPAHQVEHARAVDQGVVHVEEREDRGARLLDHDRASVGDAPGPGSRAERRAASHTLGG